ncbi:hypothetical protein MASR1M8_00910 [Thermomonas brevis]
MQTANVIVAIIAAYLFCFGVMALLVDARRIQVGGLHAMGMGTILLGLSYVIQLAFDAPGLRLADVVNHTLSTMGPIMLLVGVRGFLGMPVPSRRLLWGMAAAYTLAQVAVSLAAGDFHRYTLLSVCAVAIFGYLSLTSWQASVGIARDLRLELRTLGTISLGFAFLHGMKAVFVLRDGAAALDLGRWHQLVFYAYMAAMAVVVVPLVMWMVFKRLTSALEAAAVRDPLTGALNRRGMKQRLEEHLAGRHTHGAHLLLLDVDHFKAINDAHGHQVGDEVLVRLAQVLATGIRKGDFVARTGGEEFIVGCLDADADAAIRLAERLRTSVAATAHPLPGGGPGLHCTVSIGVSRRFRHADQLDEAMRGADAALYESKHAGRNRSAVAAQPAPA